MNGDPVEISTIIAMAGLVLTVVALTGGVVYRVGVLANRVDNLDLRFDRQAEGNRETREELRQEIHQTREELRQEIHQTREDLRQEIHQTREDLRQEIRDMREDNRRNHQQLLQALAHHSHDPDTGFAIFRIPPGTENPTG